jgi:hypothetical protein
MIDAPEPPNFRPAVSFANPAHNQGLQNAEENDITF